MCPYTLNQQRVFLLVFLCKFAQHTAKYSGSVTGGGDVSGGGDGLCSSICDKNIFADYIFVHV